MVRGVLIVVFATFVTLATAGVAPRTDIFELFNSTSSIDLRFSDDVFEDAVLDMVSYDFFLFLLILVLHFETIF